MDMVDTFFLSIGHIFMAYKLNITITLIIIIAQIVIIKIAVPLIEKYTEDSRLKYTSFEKARKSLVIISFIVSFSLITFVWGFDFRELLTVSAGVIALLGVSLFAGWSILSNVTAFFLLLIDPSYKRGNFIRIIFGENYIEGYISEINLFNTKLITEEKEIVIHPNTLLLLNPVLINPRKRYSVVGKVADFGSLDHKAAIE